MPNPLSRVNLASRHQALLVAHRRHHDRAGRHRRPLGQPIGLWTLGLAAAILRFVLDASHGETDPNRKLAVATLDASR
jgi:hypothetical protein